MVNKKFTILTASYNTGIYLNSWAESIMSQNYRPLEVVCVEDKSTDGSLKILKKISKKFEEERIEFKLIQFSQKKFCGSAYGKAIKYATGSYIGILDSDDMLENYACEFIASIYDKYPEVAWIYTQYDKYNRSMNRVIKRGFCRYPGKKKSILSLEKQDINIYGHWRTFSDRVVNVKKLFKKGLKCCVDKNMGFRLEEEGIGMFVDKVCYRYRSRSRKENSIVYRYNLKEIKKQLIKDAERRRNNKKSYPILRYME